MLAAIDLETTGLEAGYHEITEIGIYPERGPPFSRRVRPRFPERQNAIVTELTGINPYEPAPYLEEVLDDLDEYLNGQRFEPIAHNWPFEYSFLANVGGDFFQHNRALCTLQLAHAAAFRHKLPASKSLGSLCAHFGIVNEREHRALPDDHAGLQLFYKLKELLS